MAQLFSKGELAVGDTFRHESIIGSIFDGCVAEETQVGKHPAIVPTIAARAWQTGHNTIFIDEEEPFHMGFIVR
jgi:4-hydroxyproline epimerase